MTLRELILLALQVSIVLIVFGFGLKTTAADLLYLLRRPRLLVRSLLAVLVIMPLVALLLDQVFEFPLAVEFLLVALALSPVPPLLPRKESKAGGQASYGLGLMALLAFLAILMVPVSLELVSLLLGRPLTVQTGAIAGLVLKSTLLPLAAGLAVRVWRSPLAERLGKVVGPFSILLLVAGVLPLLIGTASAIWALAQPITILAFVMFTVAGLIIGHLLGGPNPNDSAVLALSTACRHPAIALSISAANFPDEPFGPLVLLYLILSGIVTIPYLKWQRHQVTAAARAA